jgi:hypothetical protein
LRAIRGFFQKIAGARWIEDQAGLVAASRPPFTTQVSEHAQAAHLPSQPRRSALDRCA